METKRFHNKEKDKFMSSSLAGFSLNSSFLPLASGKRDAISLAF